MNKKGFTLIELLAVVVMLAIIALIAFPIINGVVEKARKNSVKASAQGYFEALEKQVVLDDLKSDDEKVLKNIKSTKKVVVGTDDKDLKIKGNKPTSGNVLFNDKYQVNSAELTFKYGNKIYKVKYANNKFLISNGEPLTITFDSNGGSTVESIKIKEGSEIGILPTPTKTNYLFFGWYYDKELTHSVSSTDIITENQKLYAKWTKEFQNIEGKYYSYEGKEFIGTGVDRVITTSDIVDSATSSDAEKISIKYCTGCRLMTHQEAYRWGNCGSNPESESRACTNQNIKPATTTKANSTIFFVSPVQKSSGGYQWAAGCNSSSCLVGANQISYPYQLHGVRPTVSIPNGAGLDGDGTKDNPYRIILAQYTVSFETNGGNKLQNVKKSVLKNLSTPKKSGYIFDGWYHDKGLTIPYVDNEFVEENITLYAKWIEPNVFVSPNGDDNSNGTKDHPYKTVAKALTEAQTGDIVYIQAGEYQLSSMPINDYGQAGIYDNNKKLTIIGDNEKTILKYDGSTSAKRDGYAIRLKNSNSIIRNLVYEYKPGKSSSYSNAIFSETSGSAYNIFFRVVGPTKASYLYYNSGTTKLIKNCTFFFDLNKVDNNYSGSATYENIATNVDTQPYAITTVVNNFGTSDMTTQELITASKNAPEFEYVGVFNGNYSW